MRIPALLARTSFLFLFRLCCAGALIAAASTSVANTSDPGPLIAVSWANFQEERWKTDESALKQALVAAGARYISADAQSQSAKQLADIEGLLARGGRLVGSLAHSVVSSGGFLFQRRCAQSHCPGACITADSTRRFTSVVMDRTSARRSPVYA